MDNKEFAEQLLQEKLSTEKGDDDSSSDLIQHGRTKVDPDGTVYEWDCEKKAWFPKIDEDFIAQYQMNYGSYGEPAGEAGGNGAPKADSAAATGCQVKEAESSDPYHSYYYQYYQQYYGGTAPADSKEYEQWYNYYYGSGGYSESTTDAKGQSDPTSGDSQPRDTALKDTGTTKSGGVQDGQEMDTSSMTEEEKDRYEQWIKYWESCGYTRPEAISAANMAQANAAEGTTDEQKDSTENADVGSEAEKGKAAKRKAEPATWFEMDRDDDKNTNVYVSGLPTDITELEFTELMSKCGLITYDPVSKKPKFKLYKDKEGKYKGDALCCYIKAESVDLALQIIDGYTLREQTISVERARFELKGAFDPSKRRRKLTNKEKKKMQEKQQKLFDWRPDKPRGTRGRNERVVVVKNVFSPHDFDTDPLAINEIRDDLRDECSKYGEVRKVMVYDRNPEGVATITFKEATDADVCIEALNGRWFAAKQLSAAAWDGREKFMVEESEEEHKKRIKKWDDYLAKGGGEERGEAPPPGSPPKPSAASPPASGSTSPSTTPSSQTVDGQDERQKSDDDSGSCHGNTEAEKAQEDIEQREDCGRDGQGEEKGDGDEEME